MSKGIVSDLQQPCNGPDRLLTRPLIHDIVPADDFAETPGARESHALTTLAIQ
jgi:hypothetical protein